MEAGSQLERDLFEELLTIPTVDAHEHLPPEAERLKTPADCLDLFSCYCRGDLVSAGASGEDFACWQDKSQPLSERWQRFAPFLSAIRTGGYAQAALLVVRDLLKLPDLNDDTYQEASERLQQLRKPGYYDWVLRETCNIVSCIQCWQYGNGPFPDYFCHLAPGKEVVDVFSPADLTRLKAESLTDLVARVEEAVTRWRADPAVVGIKSTHAYARPIDFRRTSPEDATAVLARILAGETLSLAAGQPLQDYLIYELVDRAATCGLPIVIHTGLQAGNGNRIRNADPLLLQELLENFPNCQFDLFHAGMPWVREIGVLGKYFPNVYLNLAWSHIINPAQARSALSEWLDMMPNTKIFGFGGDYSVVEKVYGHLTIARQNIAAVLADKVTRGAFNRSDASMVARRLLLENPDRFYQLGLS